MGKLVGKVADDAADDLGPQMCVATGGAVLVDAVEALIDHVEAGGGARAHDFERSVAVHQAVRPGPAPVEEANGVVVEN